MISKLDLASFIFSELFKKSNLHKYLTCKFNFKKSSGNSTLRKIGWQNLRPIILNALVNGTTEIWTMSDLEF